MTLVLDEDPVENFLAHYGVQGMKWGVRRAMNRAAVNKLRLKGLTGHQAKATVRYQNAIDAQKMAATGRNGKVGVLRQLNNRAISGMHMSTLTALRHPLSVKKASALQLQKDEMLRKKVLAGQAKVRNYLFELRGISIRNINYSLAGGSKPTDYSRRKGFTPGKVATRTPRKRGAAFIPAG